MALVIRQAIADFINVGTSEAKEWALCGTGFTQLDESPNAQMESKIYVHQKEASPSITRYEPVFAFTTELWSDEAAIMKIYNIARNRKTSANAQVEYLRTDLLVDEEGTPITTVVPARLMTVTVEVSDISGEGGEAISVSGNLNQVGAFVDGGFDLSTKAFSNVIPAGFLLVKSVAGTQEGDTKITVTPAKKSGNSYVYKFSSTAPALPALGEVLNAGWTSWNGTADITVTNEYIVVAEIDTATTKAVKAGWVTVVSND